MNNYDAKCYALAVAFMEDHQHLENRYARIQQLEQEIQTLIDDVIDEFETEDRDKDFKAMKAEYDACSESDLDPRDPKSDGYAERIYEAADMERKRLREEG